MRLVILSDIHVAKIWDKIDKIVPSQINYLNPNRIFKQTLKSIRDEDLLIINGDLIDYYDSNYFGSTQTNWNNFFEILNTFNGEKLLNLGNHDYRRLAYNFKIYDLQHVNIAPKIFNKYAKKIGHTKFRFFKEIKSIKNNLRKFNPIPKKIDTLPLTKIWNNSEILLLNTEADACNYLVNFLNPLNWKLILSSHLCSQGLNKNNISKLNETLTNNLDKELLIFLHCPPFLSDKAIPKVKLNKKNYRKTLRSNGLDYSMFLKNNWNFIDAILKSNRNITLITSHSHIAKQYIIDKQNGTLKDTNIQKINEHRSNERYIKIVSTYPLGSTKPTKKIGYLTITNSQINYHLIQDYSN